MKYIRISRLFGLIMVGGLVVACSGGTAPTGPQDLNVMVWQDPDPAVNVRCYSKDATYTNQQWDCVEITGGSGSGIPAPGAIPTLPPTP